jgi:hypothetical protein
MFVRAVVGQNDMQDVSPDFFEAPSRQKRFICLDNLEQGCTHDQGAQCDVANPLSGERRLRGKTLFDVALDRLPFCRVFCVKCMCKWLWYSRFCLCG